MAPTNKPPLCIQRIFMNALHNRLLFWEKALAEKKLFKIQMSLKSPGHGACFAGLDSYLILLKLEKQDITIPVPASDCISEYGFSWKESYKGEPCIGSN